MDNSEDDVDGGKEYLFKVVVVGDSAVGKSNLLSRREVTLMGQTLCKEAEDAPQLHTKMEVALFFLLVTTLLATHSHAASPSDQVHLLRPQSGAAGKHIHGVNCLSWRLAVETNNLQKWTLVPEACEQYVGHYMLGRQYRDDCNAVGESAAEYAKSLRLAGDGKDIWVFDIDETTLSNLPYYARTDVAFGAVAYNDTTFNEWVATGKAPAVPGALKLYKKLVSMGFKIVFLSGTSETYREVRITNLKKAGYHTWEKLILK
ncbi:hypothetical protein RJ639_003542 [Escallonia herrerae]|uniref:Uncharacterized protein n=1 Tax=Escallonia herrerae TaxID=1293975 RepID=A0AA89AX95_9ASTE|nr:hypothetical protein RJ639_003542 [Escallonia herrerae]